MAARPSSKPCRNRASLTGRGPSTGSRPGSSTGNRSPGRGRGRSLRPLGWAGLIWRLSSARSWSEKNWRSTPPPALEAPPTSQRPPRRWQLMPGPLMGLGLNCFSTKVVPRTAMPSPGWGSAASTAALASVVPATTRHPGSRSNRSRAPAPRAPRRVPLATTSGNSGAQSWLPRAPLQRFVIKSQPSLRLLPSSPQRQSPRSQPISQSA